MFPAQFRHLFLSDVRRNPEFDYFSPELREQSEFMGIDVFRKHHNASSSKASSCIGNSQSMVPTAGADQPSLPLFIGQTGYFTQRTSYFEGTCSLEALKLKVDSHPGSVSSRRAWH
jgi:hypothetical protein